jgi:hypothetical protein
MDVIINCCAPGSFSITQEVDLRSGRGDAFLKQSLAQQSVDKCAFPGVKLSYDDQQEKLIQLVDGTGQCFVIGGSGPELDQGYPQIAQDFSLSVEQGFLLFVEYSHNSAIRGMMGWVALEI